MKQALIIRERTQLDELLAEKPTSLLIILGELASPAADAFFAVQREVVEPWRRAALVNASLLKQAERDSWGLGKETDFVVLDEARRPVQKGPLSMLLLPSGSVSLLSLRQAFARAELGSS